MVAMTKRSKETNIIKDLAVLVRSNEEKLLSGYSKLSLTTSVLNYLNDCLSKNGIGKVNTNIESNLNNAKTNLEDLNFLYNFICRIKSLKISHGSSTLQGRVDLSRFNNLEYLEIKKCPIHLVTGLQTLRSQIKTLICSRCIQTLEDLFQSCGGDRSTPFVWKELHTLNLSFNNIEELDDSLRYLPSVEIFDLSHNHIRETFNHLEYFWDLIALNLGFNLLTAVPSLNVFTRPKLHSLILKNNNLDSIKGMEMLINLQELDLSNNCLNEHLILDSLGSLHQLNWLNLLGNPLSYHVDHRIFTMNMLHHDSIKESFILDHVALSCTEILYLAKRKDALPTEQLPSLLIVSEGNAVNPVLHHYSINSGILEKSNNVVDSPELNSKTGKTLKSNRKPRTVTIVDQLDTSNDKIKIKILDDLSNSLDHLKTKEENEHYRKHLGDDWLVASKAIKESKSASITLHLSAEEEKESRVSASADIILQKNHENVLVNPSNKIKLDQDNDTIVNKDDIPSMSYDQPFEDASDVLQRSRLSSSKLHLDLSKRTESSSTSESFPISPLSQHEEDYENEINFIDGEREPFVVQFVKDDNELEPITLFLSIIDHYLLEKNWNARVVEQLDLKSLIKVEKIDSSNDGFGPALVLKFNYMRKDRRKRHYIMEDEEECQSFRELIEPFIESKSLQLDDEVKYQCLKCSKCFCQKEATKSTKGTNYSLSLDTGQDFLQEILICPSCGSEHIVNCENGDGSHSSLTSGSVPSDSYLTPIASSLSDNTFQKQKTSASSLETTSYLSNYASPSFFSSPEPSDTSTAYLSLSQGPYDSLLSSSPSIYSTLGGTILNSTLSQTLVKNSFNREVSEHSNPVISLKEEIERAEMAAMAAANNRKKVSLERNSEPTLKISFKDPSMKRSESDITILSNPSQSSISVLTDPSQDGLMTLSEEVLEQSEFVSGLGRLNASPILDRSISVDEGVTLLSRPTKCITSTTPHVEGGTESSNGSSGSSVCTAYESNFIEEEQITSENDMTPTGPEELTPWIVGGDPSFEDIDESNSSQKNLIIKNAVQSLNPVKWIHRTLTPMSSSLEIHFSYKGFLNIDHRLRLFFDMFVLKDSEELYGVLKAGIIQFKKNEEFLGLLVLSTTSIYIFKINEEENEHVERWLQKVEQQPLVALQSINIGYGDQSFILGFGNDGPSYIIILRDTTRCTLFLQHLQKIIRKTSFRRNTTLHLDTINNIKSQLLPSSEDDQFNIIFYHMGYWKMTNKDTTLLESISVIIINDSIVLSKEKHYWPAIRLSVSEANKGNQFELLYQQAINDITGIDLYKDACNECSLRFFNEHDGTESCWKLVMETEDAIQKLILALKEPWEKEFAQEQPITYHPSVLLQGDG